MRYTCLVTLLLSLLLSGQVDSRPAHVDTAAKYLYVRETKGANRSPEIDKWNRFCKASLGDPYCASSQSWFIEAAENAEEGWYDFKVRSAWSQAFKTAKARPISDVSIGSYSPKSGDFLVWRSGNSSKGHVEVIEWYDYKRKDFHTIGYNTSSGVTGDQRDGDGGFRRVRRSTPGSYFRITHIVPVNYYENLFKNTQFDMRTHSIFRLPYSLN